MELPAGKLAMKPPCPSQYLDCREHFQKCKFRLRRSENELMAALGVSSVAELEGLLLHEAHKRDSPFAARISAYYREHEALGAADRAFEAATTLQRQRIAAADAAAVEMAKTFSNLEC
jgi:hypothetical protein